MAWNEPGSGGGNGKDPWGRPKKEDGPPDLDELAKKMKEKLGEFLGSGSGGNSGKSGNSGGFGGSGMQNYGLKGIGLIALALLFLWSLFGFYTVQPAYQGVELRFGKHIDTTLQGLNWNWPYPVGKIIQVNVEKTRAVQHKALMLTQDENIVEIELVVQYKLRDAGHYLFNVREPENTLLHATESALRGVVGTSKMDYVLTSGRTEAAHRTKTELQAILDSYVIGLAVHSVNMQNAQPPEQVQAAFADVIKAREDEVGHKNTATAYANEVEQKAEGNAHRIRQEAEAYKAEVTARSEGETKRFLNVLHEYAKAPEVTRDRMYRDAMETVYTGSSKVMMDVKQGNQLLVFPLDRFLAGGAGSRPAAENDPQSSGSPAAPLPRSEEENRRGDSHNRRRIR
ncbi:MAG: FtsH protease activity modulator HflK [Gammaproteobacteria bacterium]|nr:FtsH protease activity modulator HflK [Gammaproteobacteria bacterium]